MVDTDRQLPSPSASAWLIDLAEIEGPTFVVLRLDESAARVALARYLVDIGAVSRAEEASQLVRGAAARHAGVVW